MGRGPHDDGAVHGVLPNPEGVPLLAPRRHPRLVLSGGAAPAHEVVDPLVVNLDVADGDLHATRDALVFLLEPQTGRSERAREGVDTLKLKKKKLYAFSLNNDWLETIDIRLRRNGS